MREITYLEAIKEALDEEMKRDPNVFILGEDVGVYGGAFRVTEGFYEKYGEWRVLDTPLSESGFTGAAVGAALVGMRPVVEMQFADFISCAFDQLVNVAAKNHYRWGAATPIVVRAPYGGNIHGGAFHSQCIEGFFFNVPGLKIVAPSTAYDAKGLLKAAIRDNDPVIYCEHKYLYRRVKDSIPEEDYVVPIGKARVALEGNDVSIITYGAMVHTALEAAQTLKENGVSCEIIDLRTILPLDKKSIFTTVKRQTRLSYYMSRLKRAVLALKCHLSLPNIVLIIWMVPSFALQPRIHRYPTAHRWKRLLFRSQRTLLPLWRS